ncbi:glutathione S-transferase N-terminal domain-containing protein [uncultured Bartonella sp.]|uniref:glutathione S-transferase family protein n=1 Tax=uncultured Bartonella sp. TaxID=104108 RepID=UPI002607AA45|nr:glutathione S-transferase N-terminal domain-containing protein [uncultured Bartonella sp.]
MLVLWGRPTSSNVKKVLWTLEEIGLDYQYIKAGGAYGGLDTPEFLALNPNGLVPTIKDDDLVLWESNTIVRYLAARYGKGVLWIEDCGKRASAEKWMDWTMGTLFEPFVDLLLNVVRLAPEKRDPQKVVDNVAKFENGLGIIDGELKKHPYLSGENLGIGDIIPGVFVYYYYAMKLPRKNTFSNVEIWYQKLQTRPGYIKHVMTPIS